MRYIVFTSLLVLLSSCLNVSKDMPHAEGEPGEILVHIPEEYKDAGIEEVVNRQIDGEIPGVFVKEPLFDLIYEYEKPIEKVFHRNILQIKIEENSSKEVFTKKSGFVAQDQHHLIVYAPSVDEAKNMIREHRQNIINSFNQQEFKRLQSRFKMQRNDVISDKIYDEQKVYVTLPSNFKDFKYNNPEFSLVAGDETRYSSSGNLIIQEYFFLMQFPDNGDSANFTKDGLVWQANKYLKTWAKYKSNLPNKDAFMQIAPEELFPLYTKELEFREMPAMELRGNIAAWDDEGEQLPFGGYFVGLAVRDLEGERIVLAIGLVNVPRDFLYREYLRQMQAIVYSIEP